jgi:hypothetical protein
VPVRSTICTGENNFLPEKCLGGTTVPNKLSRFFFSGERGHFGLGSVLKFKFISFRDSKWRHRELWTLTVEAWRLKMEPCEGL